MKTSIFICALFCTLISWPIFSSAQGQPDTKTLCEPYNYEGSTRTQPYEDNCNKNRDNDNKSLERTLMKKVIETRTSNDSKSSTNNNTSSGGSSQTMTTNSKSNSGTTTGSTGTGSSSQPKSGNSNSTASSTGSTGSGSSSQPKSGNSSSTASSSESKSCTTCADRANALQNR